MCVYYSRLTPSYSPDYFYQHMDEVAVEMGANLSALGSSREWCTVHPSQGIGYARSTEQELSFIQSVGRSTGILLDPVYSGKAMYYFSKMLDENRVNGQILPGQRVLFVHTGGVLGIYDKIPQLSNIVPNEDVQPFDLSYVT